MPLSNAIVVPSEGSSGGLWLVWGEEVGVQEISKSKNMIVTRVIEKRPKKDWICIGVYGDPNRVDNPVIWQQLETYVQDSEEPVMLMGDFNAIFAISKKSGGTQQMSTANRSFWAWISSAGLIDLGHHGPAYTWSNKKGGKENIAERLDHALATVEWSMQFPNSSVYHLPRFQSDYLPILIKTESNSRRAKPKFKCENWWLLKDEFSGVCEKAVRQGGANWFEVQSKFKSEVKRWLKETKTPHEMLKELEGKMKEINAKPQDQVDPLEENELQMQHRKALQLQEHY